MAGLVTGILTAIDNRVSAKEVPSLTVRLKGLSFILLITKTGLP